MLGKQRSKVLFCNHKEMWLIQQFCKYSKNKRRFMCLKEDQHFQEGGMDRFPKINCLEVVFVLMFSHFNMFLFALKPTKTGPGNFAIMVCWLSTHHTVAISSALFLHYRQIFIHILTYQIAKQCLLLQSSLNLFLSAFTPV